MGITLSSCENGDIDICPNKKLSDLRYADDVVLLIEDSNKLQILTDCLSNGVPEFGMHFAPSLCEMPL